MIYYGVKLFFTTFTQHATADFLNNEQLIVE